MFGDPFDDQLTAFIEPLVRKVLENHPEGKVAVHSGKTVVCMEGPQFSTRAESNMYRQWGVSATSFFEALYLCNTGFRRMANAHNLRDL